MSLITLIRPPAIMPYYSVTTSQGVPPLGLAYLAGTLKKMGHNIVAIDAFGEALHKFTPLDQSKLLINGLIREEIIERIPDKVDIIGVSCMYSNEWLYAKMVIKSIIERFANIPVLVGGEHVTADPEYVFKTCPGIHSCVLGEGEETIVELISAINEKGSLDTVKGICYLDSKMHITKTSHRHRIKKIDQIPWPSWDEIPLENYFKSGFGMISMRGRSMPIIASRGCPFQCTFCSNRLMWESKWISRDPKLVVEEMKYYIKRFNVTNFEFYDLTASIKKSWIEEFTGLLMREKLNITWSVPSGTLIKAFDSKVLRRVYESGCRTLTCAPESGSKATLRRIKKEINLNQILQFIREAVKNKIEVKANIVIGFPGQKMIEVIETFWFVLKMILAGVHDVAIFPFTPYPGSELFSQLVKEGKIKKDDESYEIFLANNVYNYVARMRSWSEYISSRLIKFLTVGGMICFYILQFILRPHRMISMIYRLIRSKPRTMLDRTLDGIIRNFILGRKGKEELANEKFE